MIDRSCDRNVQTKGEAKSVVGNDSTCVESVTRASEPKSTTLLDEGILNDKEEDVRKYKDTTRNLHLLL